MNPGLERLGRDVAAEQQRRFETFDLDAQRTRFLLHALLTPPRRRWPRGWSAAALATAALLLALWWRRDDALSFRVAGEAGRDNTWIAAPAASDLPLVFSDGSRVVLGAGARARVMKRSQRGAHLLLERGTLRAQIMHRKDTSWRVDAGPFQVHVVGTAFELSWRDERFALQLQEGAVRVVGPALFETREVFAGERLALDLASQPPAAPPATQPVPQVTALAPPQPAPVQLLAARPVSTWRKLAADGAYGEAFRALSAEGLEPLLRTGTPADLAQAADVARFAGHSAQARRALVALRARFPATAAAGEAAFTLGRLVFGQPSSALEAVRWFEVYRQEQPQGAFAREAAGRLIECHVQLQHAEHAAQAAREYLEFFPDGPHAALARSVLDGSSQHTP